MRTYRDAKAMARTLRQTLAAKGLKISVAESLELVAKQLGLADWNTLAAAIRAAPAADEVAPVQEPRASADPPPADPTVAAVAVHTRPSKFSDELTATLHRAVALANHRTHTYVTLEHLLLAMLDDADASAVLEACQVHLPALRETATRYIDDDLRSLINPNVEYAGPTAGFHRVVQRAVIHVQSSGRMQVTAANLLVAMFSETESHACAFLQAQRITRFDAVNFIAHGKRKGEPG